MAGVEVSRDIYNEALGDDLPETVGDSIKVDCTGYAEEVAAVLGEDYMDRELFIFGPEQESEPAYRENSDFWHALVHDTLHGVYVYEGDVYENERFVEQVTQYGPLVLELGLITLNDGKRGYELLTRPVDRGGMTTFTETYTGFTQLAALDETDLRDDEIVEELLSWADSHREEYDVLTETGIPARLGQVSASGFSFNIAGIDGTVKHTTATVGETTFDLNPIAGTNLKQYQPDPSWPLIQSSRNGINGTMTPSSLVEAVHTPVTATIFPPAPDETPSKLPKRQYPEDEFDWDLIRRRMIDDHYQREREELLYTAYQNHDPSNGPLLGVVKSVHDDVNVLVPDNIHVNAVANHGSIHTYGSSAKTPDFDVVAQSTHHDVNVYYLPLADVSALDRYEPLPNQIWKGVKNCLPLMPHD